jgi:hypothetical protein
VNLDPEAMRMPLEQESPGPSSKHICLRRNSLAPKSSWKDAGIEGLDLKVRRDGIRHSGSGVG